MTAAELRNIILSAEFQTGLEEVSSYLASITQEAPIVHLVAKCLWKQKQLYALERYKKHDLTVWTPKLLLDENRTTIEFKFNYETCSVKLDKELRKLAEMVKCQASSVEWKESNWDVMPRILKDVRDKEPDMFVWIICSRDLSGFGKDALERVVNWKPLKQYRRLHPYKTDRGFLATVDGFLQLLQTLRQPLSIRPFSVSAAEVETNGDFPSTYHFRICEFTNRDG
jgi:hypothetical protein